MSFEELSLSEVTGDAVEALCSYYWVKQIRVDLAGRGEQVTQVEVLTNSL